MAPVNAGLCAADGWDWDPDCLDVPEGTDPERIEALALVAAEYLWAATGRRLGPSCPITVRPCNKGCADGAGSGISFIPLGFKGLPWIPYMDAAGRYFNASVCGCRSECHCGPELCTVRLPGPVYDVLTVEVDGTPVPAESYALLDGETLVRLGEDCWPGCQDFTRGPGEDNTFFVTYRTGLAVPHFGRVAMSQLMGHLLRNCDGCNGCNATNTRNLQRLSRQGVDLQFQDATAVAAEGLTGIEPVDWFIRQWNPQGLGSPLRVLSPDAPKRPRSWRSVNPVGGGQP